MTIPPYQPKLIKIREEGCLDYIQKKAKVIIKKINFDKPKILVD